MKIYIQRIFFLLIVFGTGVSSAQEPLPNYLTEAESLLISDFQFSSTRMTPPPSVPVRAAAEWEEIEYLVITWQNGFQGILGQIVAAGVEECKVIITTQDQGQVSSYLTSQGIDQTNVIFLNADWDSIWIRDYAGNTVYENDVEDRALVDWIYNRPRPNDNDLPTAHSAETGIPLYITDTAPNDLVNTGGNYMSDGLGNAFASELILEENESGNPYGVSAKTEAHIDQIMEDYMGITNYIKMIALPFDVINHIDMHMKLLDEETILVSRYPDGVADGPQIEENIDYVLNNFQSPFGTPYKVNWIDAPPSTGGSHPDTGAYYRTFTNATFINKTILLPIYRPEVDAPAIAQWQEMMPGYNIVGIDVDNAGENLISQLGAIHCITHTIGVADPLLIVHQQIEESEENTSVLIEASIKHRTGVNQAKVFYRQEGATAYAEVSMAALADDIWAAMIPMGTENVEYYIWAEATSGKSLARPIVAPEGYWKIQVGELGINDTQVLSAITGPYPNPTTGDVQFKLNNLDGELTVTVRNLLGQTLFVATIEEANGTVTIQLQDDWQGTLFATFEGAFGVMTKKIIKL